MKKKKVTVSVIIPVFNEERYIGKCLESVKKQNFKSFEVLVIDDGSTDSSKLVISRYRNNNNIRLYSLLHQGPGACRNYGAKLAQGKILIFLDADMYIDKNYLQNIIKPIIEKKCVSSYTLKEYVANSKNMWAICWNINNNLSPYLRIKEDLSNTNKAVRAILKDEFFKLGGFNPAEGYFDDRLKLCPFPVVDAVSYHYNPDTLKDVFFSARWIGRSPAFYFSITNFLRYSIFNSIRVGIKKIIQGAPLQFLIFKIVFDMGIICGMIIKNAKNNYSK